MTRLLSSEFQCCVQRLHEFIDLDWFGEIPEESRLQALGRYLTIQNREASPGLHALQIGVRVMELRIGVTILPPMPSRRCVPRSARRRFHSLIRQGAEHLFGDGPEQLPFHSARFAIGNFGGGAQFRFMLHAIHRDKHVRVVLGAAPHFAESVRRRTAYTCLLYTSRCV